MNRLKLQVVDGAIGLVVAIAGFSVGDFLPLPYSVAAYDVFPTQVYEDRQCRKGGTVQCPSPARCTTSGTYIEGHCSVECPGATCTTTGQCWGVNPVTGAVCSTGGAC